MYWRISPLAIRPEIANTSHIRLSHCISSIVHERDIDDPHRWAHLVSLSLRCAIPDRDRPGCHQNYHREWHAQSCRADHLYNLLRHQAPCERHRWNECCANICAYSSPMEGRKFVVNQLSPKITQGISATLIIIRASLCVSNNIQSGTIRNGLPSFVAQPTSSTQVHIEAISFTAARRLLDEMTVSKINWKPSSEV